MQEEIQHKKYKNVEEESLMNTWQKWEDQWKCVCAQVHVWVLIGEAEVHEKLVKSVQKCMCGY
jgi:hypothetical protein